jgi:NTE family protein
MRVGVKTVVLSVAVLLQGCVSLLPPSNAAIHTIDGEKGYRVFDKNRKPTGDFQIALAFSGGGTRAAALSYGVMQELRDTSIQSKGQPVRLLDEVDVISSVSGGSFTSAYYGLFGDDIFKYYESDFLRKSVQSSLIDNLLSPRYWFHFMFSGINRTDMAVDYYDRTVFHGKTFADIPLDKRPFIEINATDLSAGQHFAFTQGYFDLLCSDLYSYKIARAVTASSGVPIAFPPVVLKNHATECDTNRTYLSRILDKKSYDNSYEKELIGLARSYRDQENRPYIHLVDGGVSDNLGLRAILQRQEILDERITDSLKKTAIRDVVVILVNAEVKPKKTLDMTFQPPSMTKTAGALTDGLISLYSKDTRAIAAQTMQQYQDEAHAAGLNVNFYFIEVDFSALDSPTLLKYFNDLPTTLELSNEEVDTLIQAGRTILRQSPQFQQFMARNNGKLVVSPEEKTPCTIMNPVACVLK